ncbi:hypothetical protein HPB47_004502 [Ixodes persulcatus]|uniref:Uncharacterized protein n=1 Tax=Ixodes persulcatus TaxID=34615 RepID=A0AC60PGG8_IXOPE|nr:hypothetical protein HPB47_004502 [Ixodes persulcatus]
MLVEGTNQEGQNLAFFQCPVAAGRRRGLVPAAGADGAAVASGEGAGRRSSRHGDTPGLSAAPAILPSRPRVRLSWAILPARCAPLPQKLGGASQRTTSLEITRGELSPSRGAGGARSIL